MNGIRPEEHVSVSFIAAVTRQRPRDIHERGGVQGNVLQSRGDITAEVLDIEQRRSNIVELRFQLPPQDGWRAQVQREALAAPRAPECNSVAGAGSGVARRRRGFAPLPSRVGYSNKVCREVAAVHRGHVARLQWTEIAGVVPVVEVAAKTLQATHGLERGFKPLHRFEGSNPAKVPGADNGEQVEAEIGGRGSMRQDRLGIFLEVVGRQHLIFCRDEGLEESPRAARDQAKCARIRDRYREVTRYTR